MQHYFSRCVLQTYESTLTSMRCARKKNISHECVAQTHVRREATFIYKLVKVHTASSLGTKNNEYKPKITRRSSSREDSCDHGARVHRRDCHKCFIMRPRFTRAMERTATRTAHHLHLLFFCKAARFAWEFRDISFNDSSAVSSVRDDRSLRGTSPTHTAFRLPE